MQKRLNNRFELFIINMESSDLMENFFISAILSVLGIRAFLNVTDYIILGGERLHIAHVLWGGALMLIALLMLLTFIDRSARETASVIGGLGFGAFVDELGKFITHDNNYFYQPTLSLIYSTFVIFILITSLIQRTYKRSSKTYIINALEYIKDALLFELDAQEKARVTEMLSKADQKDPMVIMLTKLIRDIKPKKTSPGIISYFKILPRKIYRQLVKKVWFTRLLITIFIVTSVVQLVFGLYFLPLMHSFIHRAELISYVASGILVLIGLFFLVRKQRLYAYEMYKYSLLVSIFFTQFFLFYLEQFAALINLALTIGMYIVVRYLIMQEVMLRVQETKSMWSRIVEFVVRILRPVKFWA